MFFGASFVICELLLASNYIKVISTLMIRNHNEEG